MGTTSPFIIGGLLDHLSLPHDLPNASFAEHDLDERRPSLAVLYISEGKLQRL